MTLRPLLLAASIATAPIQCSHETDPALRQDESPADALWDLAQKFHEAHDDVAYDKTLDYLVQRYPASRWAAAARTARVDGGAGTSSPVGPDAG